MTYPLLARRAFVVLVVWWLPFRLGGSRMLNSSFSSRSAMWVYLLIYCYYIRWVPPRAVARGRGPSATGSKNPIFML